MTHSVKGVVLKSKLLGDSLRGLSLYTDKFGSVNAVVKVKKGEFPLKFEPFSFSYFKLKELGDRREIQEGRLIRHHFPENYRELHYRSRLSQLFLTYHSPPDERLLNLLLTYLPVKGEFKKAYLLFFLKFLFLQGIYPHLSSCVECGSPHVVAFSPERGGVLCKGCLKNLETEPLGWSGRLSKAALILTKTSLKEALKRQELFRDADKILKALNLHLKSRV